MIEPEIWPLVEAMNKAGFMTDGSCQGHDGDREEWQDHWAWIEFMVEGMPGLRRLVSIVSEAELQAGDDLLVKLEVHYQDCHLDSGDDDIALGLKITCLLDDRSPGAELLSGFAKAFAEASK